MSTSATPDWLLRQPVAICPCGCIGKRTKASFVDKTIAGSADVMRQAIYSDHIATQPGLLQNIDARVKLVALTALLVAVGLAHHVTTLLAVYTAVLLAAWASRVPLGFFVKRVWLFIPIFTAIVVVPATLSFVNPGDVVVPLFTWHGRSHGFTSQGLHSAGRIVARVATSVSLTVLVTITTPWNRLLAGLRGLRVPRVFVLVINMAYRYVFLLLDTVAAMYESRKARQLAAVRHDAAARRTLGATAGALLAKAGHLSDEVHQAMVARGYRGEARTLDPPRLRSRDLMAATVVLAACAAIVWGDRLLGR